MSTATPAPSDALQDVAWHASNWTADFGSAPTANGESGSDSHQPVGLDQNSDASSIAQDAVPADSLTGSIADSAPAVLASLDDQIPVSLEPVVFNLDRLHVSPDPLAAAANNQNDSFDGAAAVAAGTSGMLPVAPPIATSSISALDTASGITGLWSNNTANPAIAGGIRSDVNPPQLANGSGVDQPVVSDLKSSAAVAEPSSALHATAGLANAPADLFSTAGTSASIGAGGATAAQVQQAIDESGLSVNGSGIKVGVLSDSFNDLGGAAADETDGALPSASNIQILSDLSSGGTDEGRAMMQIIHDIAPGADLAFYTAFNSEQDFANGILALAAAGCKVICDDVSYFDEPFFQNGIVAQAIQTVEAEGVTYVTAAGNDANNGYQATWTPISGTYDGTSLTDAESFGGSLVQTITINTEGTGDAVPLILEWNQAYGAATSDLKILVFNSSGTLVGTATNASSGEPTNPYVEYDFTHSGTYHVAIENLSGPNPGLIKEITEGDGLPATISGANSGTVVGHAMTPGAITAGAVSTADTPAFGISPAVSESFSSSGAGAELLFANNGAALTSPDVLSPVAVSGVDDIATTVAGGLSDFYGTSAASASLAGVAALILSANPNLTPAAVEMLMEETALPMANAAVSGAGLVQVDPAIAAALNTNILQVDGPTVLMQSTNQYYVSVNGGAEIAVKLGNADVQANNFGGWVPIGAVQTATGFDIAWENTSGGSPLYAVWNADSNANFVSNLLGGVPANNVTLETLETTFNQDLNGDGTIGVANHIIQVDGATTLSQSGNQYDVSVNGGADIAVKLGNADVQASNFGGWVPIGAVQTATGFDVAWEDSGNGSSLYAVWNADANANFVTNLVANAAPSNSTLESLETVFNQDLNGDGTIGIPADHTIQVDGATTLSQSGNQYNVSVNGGADIAIKLGNADVQANNFGGWIPIGAVQTATGFDIAWENHGSGLYAVWNADSSANFISNLVANAAPTNPTLESLETVFNQDLNGDGVIGPPGGSGTSNLSGLMAANETAHDTVSQWHAGDSFNWTSAPSSDDGDSITPSVTADTFLFKSAQQSEQAASSEAPHIASYSQGVSADSFTGPHTAPWNAPLGNITTAANISADAFVFTSGLGSGATGAPNSDHNNPPPGDGGNEWHAAPSPASANALWSANTAQDAAFVHHDDSALTNSPVPNPHAGYEFHPPIIG